MKALQERNTNIEILRLVLMIAIFCWHLIIWGMGFGAIGYQPYPYPLAPTAFCLTAFVPAVDCFMFISGWFGIKFKLSKFLKLSFTCSIAAILCVLVCLLVPQLGGVNMFECYGALFPVSTTFRWWFITCYALVFLVSPFVEEGFRYLSQRTILSVLAIMTAIQLLSLPCDKNYGSTFFGLLYLYIIGRYMRYYNVTLNRWSATILYASSFLLILVGMFCLSLLPVRQAILMWWLQFNNPLIILESIAVFFLFWNLKPFFNRRINRFLAPCLCIYLFTEGIKPYKLIINCAEDNILLGVLFFVLFIMISLLLGLFVTRIASLLSDRIGVSIQVIVDRRLISKDKGNGKSNKV